MSTPEGRMECLGTPSQCIPNYPAAGSSFLDAQLTSLQPKSGYRHELRTGAAIESVKPAGSELRGQVSPSSVKTFAYLAVPVQPGRTGIRAFCGDSNGIVCFTADGSEPRVTDGTCDVSSCQVLQ